MPAMSLLSIQAANQTKPNHGQHTESASSAGAEHGSFQQLLSQQVNKEVQKQEGHKPELQKADVQRPDEQKQNATAKQPTADESKTVVSKLANPEQSPTKTVKLAADKPKTLVAKKTVAEQPVLAQDTLAMLAALLPAAIDIKPEDLKIKSEEHKEEDAGAIRLNPQTTVALTGLTNGPVIRPENSAQASSAVSDDRISDLSVSANVQPRMPVVSDKPLSAQDNLQLAQSELTKLGVDAGPSLDGWVLAPQTASLQEKNKEVETKLDFAKLMPVNTIPLSTAPMIASPAMQNNGLNLHRIEAAPGSRAWSEAVSQKVVWMVGAQEQSVMLTLNPPDLGPLQVVIHVHNEQADATFISQNPEVRQALQDGMDTLSSMMSSSGIQLGEANVSSNNQAQQQFQQAQRRAPSAAVTASAGISAASVTARTSAGLGLVDIFA